LDTGELSFALLRDGHAAVLADTPVITATDGNHGRAVAWAAQQLGCSAVVYLPRGSSQARFDAIASHGADTSFVDCGYDDAVALAAEHAVAQGWLLVQDTAWPGYERIPQWIMQGYLTILDETFEQLRGHLPTHVFVQSGVGSLAGALAAHLNEHLGTARPFYGVVEPTRAACCYHSMAAGGAEPRRLEGELDTIMAGLACGVPSRLAWWLLRDYADVFVACDDDVAVRGMRALAHPLGNDPAIISGESGAVTCGLLVASQSIDASVSLTLDDQSRVLIISTEGDTDPVSYGEIVA
jgi:diaminopropionate ammonia-lyase